MTPPDDIDSMNRINVFQLLVMLLVLLTVPCLCPQFMLAQKAPQSDPFDVEVPPEFSKVKQALDLDNYDQALKLLSELRSEALKTRNKTVLQEILVKTKEVNRLKREFVKVREEYETLKKNPNDSKACEQIGIFYCVEKGNWGKGLLLLSKSDKPELRKTASIDLKRPASSSQRANLADAWWSLAANEKGKIRKAFQLRGRHWYLLARPGLTQEERVSRDQQLQYIVLETDKIVIWNLHYGRASDRGTVECLVTLLYKGKPVWRQATKLPWSPEFPATQVLRPPHIRFDQLHLDVKKFRGKGGGISEIEIFDGNINVASNCSAVAKEYWEQNQKYHPNMVSDGIKEGPTGYWLLNNRKLGWILLDMVTYRQQQ